MLQTETAIDRLDGVAIRGGRASTSARTIEARSFFSRGFLIGRLLKFAREFLDTLAHDLAGLEFYGRTRRNHEAAARFIWIAADARLRQPGLKHAEIAEFDRHVIRETVRDMIECPLDHLEYVMLDHAGLVADRDDDVSFCKLGHIINKSLAVT